MCLGRARIISFDDKIRRRYHAAHGTLALVFKEFTDAAAAESVSAR